MERCARCGHDRVFHWFHLLACDVTGCTCDEFADEDHGEIAADLREQVAELQERAERAERAAAMEREGREALLAKVSELERRLHGGVPALGPLPRERTLRGWNADRIRRATGLPIEGGER